MKEEIICEGESRGVKYRLIRLPSGRVELHQNDYPNGIFQCWETLWVD